MTRVCLALMATLLWSACDNDVASPPALPHPVAAPPARPTVDVAEPSVVAPVTAPSDPAAAPAEVSRAPIEQAHHVIKRPTAAAHDAPARPRVPAAAPLGESPRPPAQDGAQALLLRAEGGACTRMPCGPDNPCCNSCGLSYWRPVQGTGILQRSDGKVLGLAGKELPQCSWESGQCGCAFDLRVVGEPQGDQFVITDIVKVPRTGVRPGVPDAPPSFSAAWFQTLLRERERSLDFCSAAKRRRNPGLAGALVVRIVVTPEGQVRDPSVTSDSVGDAAITDCITRLLQRLRVSSAPVTSQSFDVHVPVGSDEKHLSVIAL